MQAYCSLYCTPCAGDLSENEDGEDDEDEDEGEEEADDEDGDMDDEMCWCPACTTRRMSDIANGNPQAMDAEFLIPFAESLGFHRSEFTDCRSGLCSHAACKHARIHRSG